jgi:predicted  nucleic acid-binding Zn-ribbon protein
MSPGDTLLQLHDLDVLLLEARDAAAVSRLRRAGLAIGDTAPVERARARLLAALEPRWKQHYERAWRRYGNAIAAVRGRVCQGCFMGLPRSACPAESEIVTVCESCGRILYWGSRTPA